MSLPRVPVRSGYDAWAPHYDAYDNALVALEQSIVRGLVRTHAGALAGSPVLDLGCGTGRHALPLAQAGAQVTGVDFSRGMLDQLRAKLDGEQLAGGLELLEGDLTAGLPMPASSFELALCCLVLEHIAGLEAAFSELRRVCRPGAPVVIAEFHPEMFRRGLHARFRAGPEAQKVQIEGVDHTISDYVMASVRAGLEIVDMAEYCMDEATAAQSPSASKYVGEPMLLTLVVRVPD